MMKTDLNYCIVLSSEQLAYLAGSKYGIDRMKILHRLIEEAVLKETDYAIKGFSTTLQVGQAVLSEVDLANKLGYDKKTISRMDAEQKPHRQSFLCPTERPAKQQGKYACYIR